MRYTLSLNTRAGLFNQEIPKAIQGFLDGDVNPLIKIHKPEPLPEYDMVGWAVFGVPLTVIPAEFRAILKRGRGRGKGRTLGMVEKKTALPSRVARGAREGLLLRPNDLPADMADRLDMRTHDSESDLVSLGAGKPVTGEEASWEDLM